MNRCICSIVKNKKIDSVKQFEAVNDLLANFVGRGILREMPVSEPYYIGISSDSQKVSWYADKWYKCNKCGKTWELINPDFPRCGRLTVHYDQCKKLVKMFDYDCSNIAPIDTSLPRTFFFIEDNLGFAFCCDREKQKIIIFDEDGELLVCDLYKNELNVKPLSWTAYSGNKSAILELRCIEQNGSIILKRFKVRLENTEYEQRVIKEQYSIGFPWSEPQRYKAEFDGYTYKLSANNELAIYKTGGSEVLQSENVCSVTPNSMISVFGSLAAVLTFSRNGNDAKGSPVISCYRINSLAAD